MTEFNRRHREIMANLNRKMSSMTDRQVENISIELERILTLNPLCRTSEDDEFITDISREMPATFETVCIFIDLGVGVATTEFGSYEQAEELLKRNTP